MFLTLAEKGTTPPKPLHLCGHSAKGLEVPLMTPPGASQPPSPRRAAGLPQLLSSLSAAHVPAEPRMAPAGRAPPLRHRHRPPPSLVRQRLRLCPGRVPGAPRRPCAPQGGQRLALAGLPLLPLCPKGAKPLQPPDHPPVCVPVPCPQVPACFESRSLDPASPADRSQLRVKALLQQLPPQDCDVRHGFIRCCPPRGFISSLSLTSFTPCRSGTAPGSPRRRGSSSEPSAPAADGRRWGRGRNVPCQVPATAVPARR